MTKGFFEIILATLHCSLWPVIFYGGQQGRMLAAIFCSSGKGQAFILIVYLFCSFIFVNFYF